VDTASARKLRAVPVLVSVKREVIIQLMLAIALNLPFSPLDKRKHPGYYFVIEIFFIEGIVP